MGSSTSTGFEPKGMPLTFHVERWFDENSYETVAMCRGFSMAAAAFDEGLKEPSNGYLLLRQRSRVIRDSRRSSGGTTGPKSFEKQ